MAAFHSLHFIPVESPEVAPPDSPDLAAFAARKAAAKRTFHRQLVDHADEPFLGMQWDVPEIGRVLIQIDLVENTSALVTIGRHAEPPEACSLLMTAVLLSGFADADAAALDLLKTTPGFCDNPYLNPEAYEPARDAARPLMVQCFVAQNAFTNPHLRALIEALADAFFDQFGTSDDADDVDADDDRDDDDEAEAA